MPDTPVDPSSLEGDALARWYARSPTDVEQERQVTQSQRYNNFFGGLRTQKPANQLAGQEASPESVMGNQTPFSDGQTGDDGEAFFDTSGATPGDGELYLVGNPANPRLRREYSQKWGVDWPRDPITGRNYDVAHIVAKADGGKDHVDNIRPMHPADHRAEHIDSGDYIRWSKRASIARAFGGTVARAFEPLDIISGLLGIASGRVRTDNLDNFGSDIMGVPSQEDRQKALEDSQKALNPDWKPGDPWVF